MHKHIVFAIVVLLLGAGAAQAQLRGQIIVPDAQQADRIELVLEKQGGQVVGRAFSNAEGNFLFQSLPSPCDCVVVVHLEGYKEAREPITFATNGSRLVIQLAREDATAVLKSVEPDVIDIDQLSRKYPRKIFDEFRKAQEDQGKGNFAKAADRLQALIKQVPDFYEAHHGLGLALQKLQRFDEAEKEFNAARQLSPRSSLPLVSLGGMHVDRGDLVKARAELEEAVKINPQSSMGYYYLGSAYYNLFAYMEAEQSLKRALDLKKGMTPARLLSINLYIRLQRWQEALNQIDLYLAENRQGAEREQILGIRPKILNNLRK